MLNKLLKDFLPKWVLKTVRLIKTNNMSRKLRGLSTKEIFSKVYKDQLWGNSYDGIECFYSGIGSHDESVVSSYVKSVSVFLSKLQEKPNVVDLGCGDFNVGSRLRGLCSGYIACDIVPELIERNKIKYKDANVEFQVLDLVTDDVPKSDVLFIRQVLQHLSNRQIQNIVSKLPSLCKYLILTEHLPKMTIFVANIDKPSGPDIRLLRDSGVVLTDAPFNLRVLSTTLLCEVENGDGLIRTILYEFKSTW